MNYKAIVPATLALVLGLAGGVQAQGTTTGTTPTTPGMSTGTTGTTPTMPSTAPTAMTPNTAAPGTTTPGMTTPGMTNGAPVVSGTHSATNNAVNTGSQNNSGAPVPGANSFTRGEATNRIQKAGFGRVSDLALDRQGIWRGKAVKNGHPVTVAMDYQGNVTSK